MSAATTRRLAERPELLPKLQVWFESEWPSYYGPGQRGNAESDLLAYSNQGSLPVGVVALLNGVACGFAALKKEPFPSHPHLLPWVGAAVVDPSLRGQGIGRELLLALEAEARALQYTRIYCATATAVSLLDRCGWQLLERVVHEGQQVCVYEKAL